MVLREFGLIIVTLMIAVFGITADIIRYKRKIDRLSKIRYLYFVPLVITAYQIIRGKYIALMLSVYIAAIIMATMHFIVRKKKAYIALTIVTVVLTLAPIAILMYQKKDGIDSGVYASLGYETAFNELNEDLRNNYALSGWKKIDFDSKYNEYIERFREADQCRDEIAYFTALREYLDSFHDGHLEIFPVTDIFNTSGDNLLKVKENIVQNYYGMSMIKLDSGKVIAIGVQEDSSAYQAGIRNGYEILSWNGIEIHQAISDYGHIISITNTIFADEDNEELFRPFYLSCTGGDSIWVKYKRQDKAEVSTQLTSMGNGYEYLTDMLNQFNNYISEKHEGDYVGWDILDNDHGYIHIWAEANDYEEVEKTLTEGLNKMKAVGVKDIIIDVRNNTGGSDDMGAVITSLFSDKEQIYIKESQYNPEDDTYEITRDIYVENKKCDLDVPIVMLVNSQTISAGEGLTYNMKRIANVKVAGMTGTNGSFATPMGSAIMPGNVRVAYPTIACLGIRDKIIIDSDDRLIGGVKPDIVIPIDKNALRNIYNSDKDYELEYVKRYLESIR